MTSEDNTQGGDGRRDAWRCVVCGATEKLDAHHVTPREEMPAGGYVAENGASLCEPCHVKAERYPSTGPHSPEGLYRAIGSSRRLADLASQRLYSARMWPRG